MNPRALSLDVLEVFRVLELGFAPVTEKPVVRCPPVLRLVALQLHQETLEPGCHALEMHSNVTAPTIRSRKRAQKINVTIDIKIAERFDESGTTNTVEIWIGGICFTTDARDKLHAMQIAYNVARDLGLTVGSINEG